MHKPGVMQSPPFMQRGAHSAEEQEEKENHHWCDWECAQRCQQFSGVPKQALQ